MRSLAYVDRSRSFDAVYRDAPSVCWAVGLRWSDGREATLVVGWLGIALLAAAPAALVALALIA